MVTMIDRVRSFARNAYARQILKIIKARTSGATERDLTFCYQPTMSTFELHLEPLNATEARVVLSHPSASGWQTRVDFADRRSVAAFKDRLAFQIERLGTAGKAI